MPTEPHSQPTSSPWLSIWFKPQGAIRSAMGRGDGMSVLGLGVAAGIAQALGWFVAMPLHWQALIVFAVLAGAVAGLVQLYAGSAISAWAGRRLGGTATSRVMRSATAWALVPMAATLPLFAGALAVYGQPFKVFAAGGTSDGPPAFYVLVLVMTALTLWSVVAMVRTFGAVQNFGVLRSIVNVFAPALVVVPLALLFRFYAFQPFNIPANSMVPALEVGDYMYVNKASYGYSRFSNPFGPHFDGRVFAAEPERGDIAVFKLPRDTSVDYVKRIVGLPGDEIRLKGGVLAINGTPVPRRKVDGFYSERPGAPAHTGAAFEETLPNGVSYTVLDSDPDGPFDGAGPFKVPAGHCFVLGDNRDNSVDSRMPNDVGYVPFEHLVGRAALIYFSAAPVDEAGATAGTFGNIRWSKLLTVPK